MTTLRSIARSATSRFATASKPIRISIALTFIIAVLITVEFIASPASIEPASIKRVTQSQTHPVKPASTTELTNQVDNTTGTTPDPSANNKAKPQASAPTSPAVSTQAVKSSTPTNRTPSYKFTPPAYVAPQYTDPASIRAISLTPASSGCVYGSMHTAYAYVLDINPGLTIKPPLAWEYEYTDAPHPDFTPTLPLFPLYDNPIPTGIGKMYDTVPLHYGFSAMTFADYRIRLRSGSVVSNWIAVPRNSDCH